MKCLWCNRELIQSQPLLNSDLATLYGLTVKALNQQVKNNIEKFLEDFMFQLSEEEMINLSRSNFLTSMQMKCVRSYKLYIFTEQEIYMKSAVLKNGLCHDRYIIPGFNTTDEKVYLSGASSKDAGNKVSTIILLSDIHLIHKFVEKL